jgi:hypothetical protein
MNVSRYHRTISALIALTLTIAALFARPAFAIPASTRDGHNDFGFLVGSWHTEYRRLRHVLQHNHQWYTCPGHSRDENFWDGSGNIEVGDLRCPGQHIEGMVLRTYSSATRDWTLYWGTKRLGALNPPPQVGHFTAAARAISFRKTPTRGSRSSSVTAGAYWLATILTSSKRFLPTAAKRGKRIGRRSTREARECETREGPKSPVSGLSRIPERTEQWQITRC